MAQEKDKAEEEGVILSGVVHWGERLSGKGKKRRECEERNGKKQWKEKTCHCLFRGENRIDHLLLLKREREVAQSCPTLCDPMDCSPPGSSVHGILQARILEWVAISFSRGSSQPRDWTRVSCIAGRHFILWATRVITNTLFQQPKRWLYIWTSPYGQYQNQIDCVPCSWVWESSI